MSSSSPQADSSTTATEVDPTLSELSTRPALSRTDRASALKLIADSIAQQRNEANRLILYHPLTLTLLSTAVLLIFSRWWQNLPIIPLPASIFGEAVVDPRGETITPVLLSAAVFVMALSAARYFTQPYIWLAESVNWDLLSSSTDEAQVAKNVGKRPANDRPEGDAGDSAVLVTLYGDNIIGVVVLDFPAPAEEGDPAKATLKAWTTTRRYRDQGVGKNLLAIAGSYARSRKAQGMVVTEEPVQARGLVPRLFDSGLSMGEGKVKRVRKAVAEAWQSDPVWEVRSVDDVKRK